MRNKYVMNRRLNVRFLERRLKRYVYDGLVLSRYPVSYDDMDRLMEIEEGTTETEIAAINFRNGFRYVIDNPDKEADRTFLEDIHLILMKGLNENIKTSLTDEEAAELAAMLNQPTKAYTEVALDAMIYILDKRLFSDGDVRTSIMFANKIMVDHGNGVIVINDLNADEFRKYLHCGNSEVFKNWLFRTSIEGEKIEY